MHRSTHLNGFLSIAVFASLILACLHAPGYAADITLSWTRPDDTRVAGYNVYYGLSGTQYRDEPEVMIDSADQTSTIISDMPDYETFGFVMTSVDSVGNESDFSEEVVYTISEDSSDDGGGSGGGGGGGCFIMSLKMTGK